MPSTNGHNDWNKKVKKGGSSRLNLNGKGFTTPLYIEVPPLFSHNGSSFFTKKEFVEKYDLCSMVWIQSRLGYQRIVQKRLKSVLALLWTRMGIVTVNVQI